MANENEKVKLTEAEWKIMTALWEKNMTITQLTAHFRESTGWSKNVIINFLKKMKSKKAVDFIQEPTVKVFYPVITRDEASVDESQRFLNKIYNGSIGLMVNNLIENKALSDDDISELYDVLKKAEDGKPGK